VNSILISALVMAAPATPPASHLQVEATVVMEGVALYLDPALCRAAAGPDATSASLQAGANGRPTLTIPAIVCRQQLFRDGFDGVTYD
jgi:hypothetical protein